MKIHPIANFYFHLLQESPLLSLNSIQAVFFDFDGTLRHNLPAGGDVFADYAFQLGLHISHEDRLRAIRWEHYYWAESVELKADREIYCVSWKNSSVVLDTISTLWPNTKYAGANQHPGCLNARLRADSLSLVLLTSAHSLLKILLVLRIGRARTQPLSRLACLRLEAGCANSQQ